MIKRLWLLVALLPLTACTSLPKYIALDPTAKNNLGEVKVIGTIYQDEIIVRTENPGVSQAMGDGLLAAIIDSQVAKGRQNEIQETIEPFYSATDDMDFRKAFWNALEPKLLDGFQGKIADIKTTPFVLTRQERDKLVSELRGNKAFMHIATSYCFSRDFSQLNVVTSIDLWQSRQQEPIYSNRFHYQSAPMGSNKVESIKLWSDSRGKQYRAAINESIDEIAKMLVLDLKYPRINEVNQEIKADASIVSMQEANENHELKIGRTVLDDRPSRVVLRNADGRLHSLSRQVVQ